MTTKNRVLATALIAVVGIGAGGWWYSTAGQNKPDKEPDKPVKEKSDPAEAEIRKTADAFVKAFNSGDAKGIAALWTEDGEMVDAEGEEVRGRKAIQESYSTFFKENPKAKAELHIRSMRVHGRGTATEEGKFILTRPGDTEPSVSFYSALHVKDDAGWKMASVREYVPNASELISLKDIEWLIGDWVAKSDKAEARLSYTWSDAKTFVVGKYSLRRDGKDVSTGTQVIGKGLNGELRSWQFDSTGAVGQWSWWPDGKKWTVDSAEELPGGSVLAGVHLLNPLDKDTFLWQTVERSLGEVELPDLPPLKVVRVKKSK